MKEKIIKLALTDMFKNKDCFSICTIDNCLKVADAIPDGEIYNMLHVLHCIKYSDMDDETLEWLPKAITNLFRKSPVAIDYELEVKI